MLKIAQLNASSCKTYILTSGSQSLILDPLKENIPMYLAYMAYNQSRLHYIVDSHSHADHMSAAFKLRELTGAKYVMSSMAPAPKVDLHVNHGDVLSLGDSKISVLHTPGHTKDSISLYTGQHVFTGDTLFIGILIY